MSGFGTLKDMDALRKCTESIQEQELIEIKNTPEQEANLESVVVPIMESEDSWKDLVKKGGSKIKAVVESGDVVKNKPEDGAAGNAEEEDKNKEPLMGDVGLGVGSIGLGASKKAGSTKLGTKGSCSVGKELGKKGLAENFESDVVDKGPQDEARNRTRANNVVGKAKDMFDEMYGSAYGKQREFVLDTTLYGTKLSKEPISKVPKGW